MFRIRIKNIQHIQELSFETDMYQGGLTCLVGKNGTGKTTLVRAIGNILSADTFSRTASPQIFNDKSQIHYHIEGKDYSYKYDPQFEGITSKDPIPLEIEERIEVELPIPYGVRFSQFQQLGQVDDEIRNRITLKNYKQPNELIDFLNTIYSSKRFDKLKEVNIGKKPYYFDLRDDGLYIREDYLSSGEYFLIQLYKLIHEGHKLIVIDEIDVSLDASAQVNLIKKLRQICAGRQVRIVFTTHSLALMKTLENDELHYLDYSDGCVTIEPKSYNYVKSLLFGFEGWDRYILTEDIVLEAYINYLIETLIDSMQVKPRLCKFKIIPVGGGQNVVKLMEKNDDEEFLNKSDNVICMLDGDQENLPHTTNEEKVWLIPFQSIEKKFYDLASTGNIEIEVGGRNAKALYRYAMNEQNFTEQQIFDIVSDTDRDQVDALKQRLLDFLSL